MPPLKRNIVKRTWIALVLAYAALLVVALTGHGHPQAHPQAVETHGVVASSVNNAIDDRHEMDALKASRSMIRPPIQTVVHFPKVTCWNGKVVVDHPKMQDCPNRPAPKMAPHAAISGSAEAWANSAFAIRVANCESGGGPSDHHTYYDGDPHLRDGYYHGKWQMDPDFWRSYGGLRYASDAADASEAEQDAVAYKGFLARGWEPWECAHLV